MKHRVFYQDVPKARIQRAFLLNCIALAYAGALAGVSRLVLVLAWVWWYAICAEVALLLLLVGNIATLISTRRRPMLTLTPTALIYRTIPFKWASIADLQVLETPRGKRLGAVLLSEADQIIPTRGIDFRKRLLRAEIGKYGAVPVRKAKDLSIEELREVVLDYRARAVG
jgi:hypothetical protein